MPFAPGDPNINRKGRVLKNKVKEETLATIAHSSERELAMLLRKLKPHIADAVMTAAKIMKNEEAVEHNRLRAATIILDSYRMLTLDVFNPKNDDLDEDDLQENDSTPTFSLKVVNNE